MLKASTANADIQAVQKHTFQSQSQVVGCAAGAVVFSFLFLGSLLSDTSLVGRVIGGGLSASLVVILLRYGQAKVVTSPGGVDVKNPFSRYRLKWTEIEKFELGRWKLNPAMCLVRLRDGEAKPAAGIFVNGSGFGGGAKLVDGLNEELRQFASERPVPPTK